MIVEILQVAVQILVDFGLVCFEVCNGFVGHHSPSVIPTDAELVSFHSATAPMFEMIKTRQRENTRLAELRDSLLPKLMSGEIDVSAVQL